MSIEQWTIEQNKLKQQMILHNLIDINKIKYIGAIDISFYPEPSNQACVGLIIISYPDLVVLYRDYRIVVMTEPYIPGFLAFREVNYMLMLWHDLIANQPELKPDLVMVDGNGYLHKQGFGLASHFGVLAGVPTIGVSKNFYVMDGMEMTKVKDETSRLCQKKGDFYKLIGDSGTCWGISLLTGQGSRNPLFISIGHMIDLETARLVVLGCCRYRIPEPIRQVDLGTREFIRGGNWHKQVP